MERPALCGAVDAGAGSAEWPALTKGVEPSEGRFTPLASLSAVQPEATTSSSVNPAFPCRLIKWDVLVIRGSLAYVRHERLGRRASGRSRDSNHRGVPERRSGRPLREVCEMSVGSRRANAIAALVGSSLALLAPCGCAGNGQVEFISLNYRDIDPPAARANVVALDSCTWWEDGAGRVWIAMRRDASGLSELLRLTFRMSLALERLPAGAARNYVVDDETVRGLARLGPTLTRFTSVRGVLALYRDGKDRLRGSLRFEANRQAAQLLGGWGAAGRSVVLARFVASRDPGGGMEVVAATEESGFDRPRLAGPTSQPARLQPATATP